MCKQLGEKRERRGKEEEMSMKGNTGKLSSQVGKTDRGKKLVISCRKTSCSVQFRLQVQMRGFNNMRLCKQFLTTFSSTFAASVL